VVVYAALEAGMKRQAQRTTLADAVRTYLDALLYSDPSEIQRQLDELARLVKWERKP